MIFCLRRSRQIREKKVLFLLMLGTYFSVADIQ